MLRQCSKVMQDAAAGSRAHRLAGPLSKRAHVVLASIHIGLCLASSVRGRYLCGRLCRMLAESFPGGMQQCLTSRIEDCPPLWRMLLDTEGSCCSDLALLGGSVKTAVTA